MLQILMRCFECTGGKVWQEDDDHRGEERDKTGLYEGAAIPVVYGVCMFKYNVIF